MAAIAVSASMGVMKPVLGKLATLMGDEYTKLKRVRKEVSFLKHELSDMSALLEKMEDADELDPQATNWRKDIIEMSYNIEDYIDDFMNRIGEADDHVGILQKASHYLRTFKDRRRLANQFQEIKTAVIEAGERRKRYMLDQCIPSTTRVIVDPRLSALYKKSESLVGIGSQKEEIVRWVTDENKQLKVMSIVGSGGLGKTTLANEVYREVDGKFNCKAFVSISQNPDMLKLLNSIMLQLELQPYSHACELQDLINRIRNHLQNTRYFVIIDDLWDIQAWNTISCAFPQNNHCSRVLITTRIENVARASCGNHGFIYYMKLLSEQDSRKLFFSRICESEQSCPPDFIVDSRKILRKCGGLPLAIVTVASMIACQPTKSMGQWAEYIQHSLGAEFATDPTCEDMMHIINFSYKNLPHHLKACFLYLGTYPEDHRIRRVDIVKQWVAQGFVSCSRCEDVWNAADSYFCELVNRNMIQPAYEEYKDHIGMEVTHCKVHDMMLELILRKCRDVNFIAVIDGPEAMQKRQDDRAVRRLTIDLRPGVEGGTMVMDNTRHLSSKVRSLSVFRGSFRIPNLMELKFLRLLFLDISDSETSVDLSCLNHLSQLRYLKLIQPSGGKGLLIPAQIQGLRLLETFDIAEMLFFNGVPDFVDAPHLSHVLVRPNDGFGLCKWIGKMKSMVTLSGFSLFMSSLESIVGLGELTALSELNLDHSTTLGVERDDHVTTPFKAVVFALIASLEKLGNLRNLVLTSRSDAYSGDAMLEPSFSPPFRDIEQLRLELFIFSCIPRWISHLRCLRHLFLRAKKVHQEDFNVMGTSLTSLTCLYLVNVEDITITEETIVIGSSTGFSVLKRFIFDFDGLSRLIFEAGAMPELQVLDFAIHPYRWDVAAPGGLQHLPSLERIMVNPWEPRVITKEVRRGWRAAMRTVFKEATQALSTHPAVVHLPWKRRATEWEWVDDDLMQDCGPSSKEEEVLMTKFGSLPKSEVPAWGPGSSGFQDSCGMEDEDIRLESRQMKMQR